MLFFSCARGPWVRDNAVRIGGRDDRGDRGLFGYLSYRIFSSHHESQPEFRNCCTATKFVEGLQWMGLCQHFNTLLYATNLLWTSATVVRPPKGAEAIQLHASFSRCFSDAWLSERLCGNNSADSLRTSTDAVPHDRMSKLLYERVEIPSSQ